MRITFAFGATGIEANDGMLMMNRIQGQNEELGDETIIFVNIHFLMNGTIP